MNPHVQVHTISDSELVMLCLQHQRSAWEEFFRRYSPEIKKTIRRTFIKCRFRDLCEDIDNVLDIHAVIVEKLYTRGALNQCSDATGLRSWLRCITANQTYDWLKQRGRIKHLPQITEEHFLRSLSTPLGEDKDFTLQDVIEDEDADLFVQLQNETLRLYVECMIEQIATINNITQRWILRLNILGQLQLSESELENLQTLSMLQRTEIDSRIEALESSLAEKEQVRQDNLGRTVLYWHQLRGIESKIARLLKDTFSDHSTEIDELKSEWNDIEQRKDALLSSCHVMPRPSNKEIAELVGIPEDKCGNVSKYLERARDALRVKMNSFSENI